MIFSDRDGWFCANAAFTDLQKSYTEKGLVELGHESTAFQRYCVCQRNKWRGLEVQATGEKTTHLHCLHKPAISLKETEMCYDILQGFYLICSFKKFEASCVTRQWEREEKVK